MQIGYARISTNDQKLDLQKDALNKAGCEKIFTDTASGSKVKRSGLDKALKNLKSGDTLVVWKLDRLGRSLPHLIDTIKVLNQKNIGFKSLQESIDTTTSCGKLVFHIFGAIAEFERDLIRERTNAGLASARARGRIGGRPPTLTKSRVKELKKAYLEKIYPIKEVCQMFGISRATLYRNVLQQT